MGLDLAVAAQQIQAPAAASELYFGEDVALEVLAAGEDLPGQPGQIALRQRCVEHETRRRCPA